MGDSEEFLLKRISELEGQTHRAGDESKRRKLALRKVTAELEELRKVHDATLRDLEERKSRPTDEWQAKYETVRKEVWKRDHRDAWRPIAVEKLVDGVPLEEIWSKIGYEPGEEIPQKAQILERLEQAKLAAPYLFRGDGTSEGRRPTPGPPAGGQTEGNSNGRGRLMVPLGADLGRGGRSAGPGELVITRSQLQDPKFLDANKRAISEARRTGAIVVTEG